MGLLRIREVYGSSLYPQTGYFGYARDFPLSLQINAKIVLKMDRDSVLPHPYQFSIR
jgi:hypothetical protein